MFGIITTCRSSPATRRHSDLDPIILSPRGETTSPDDLEVPAAGSPRVRPTAGDLSSGLRIFRPKSRRSRKADIARARRLLAADLTYVAHPSFDDPSAHDAILAPSPISEAAGSGRADASGDADAAPSRSAGFPLREQEVHLFRKMNYLKCLACRLRDRIDPDSPDRVDLDRIERLQGEALELKNQIVETHMRLAVSFAKRRVRAGYDLSERISDGSFALMQAVDHFDCARGNRFSTYAYWTILNELARHDRRARQHRHRSLETYRESLAMPDSEIDRYEQDDAQASRKAAVDRLLRRLDGRERSIVVYRTGIGGVTEQTLAQIARHLGISKERVRQIELRAHAKLRDFANREAIRFADL
jgi:RNA polymerase primary sigma factor